MTLLRVLTSSLWTASALYQVRVICAVSATTTLVGARLPHQLPFHAHMRSPRNWRILMPCVTGSVDYPRQHEHRVGQKAEGSLGLVRYASGLGRRGNAEAGFLHPGGRQYGQASTGMLLPVAFHWWWLLHCPAERLIAHTELFECSIQFENRPYFLTANGESQPFSLEECSTDVTRTS